MPDSSAGSAAFLNGQEIINDARTLRYLDAGYGPPNLQINGGCSCPNIQELIECGEDPYDTPISDPAPWYDASAPESGDFAGFLVSEFEGMGSTYTRNTTDKITGGSVLGRLRPGPRTMTWRGFLFGRSDCAVQYGLSWMTANLVGSNCDCNGEELDILVCCPELTFSGESDLLTEGEDSLLTESSLDILLEQAEDETICGLPVIARPAVCPPFTQPDAFRTLKNVALIDGPKILSQRRVGCKASCGNDSCAGDTIVMEIEFSLMAGNPYMYGCPVCLCVEQPFTPYTDEDCEGAWEKISAIELAQINILVAAGGRSPCLPDICPDITDCTEVLTGITACDPPTLPPIVAFEDACFCEPLQPTQFCCSIPADSFGQFFEGAPVIEIFSGSMPMRATTIRFFQNNAGLDCCTVAENPCVECDSVQIRFIPANSTMTIDGTTRSVYVQCPGMSSPVRAERLTVTPFAWPILQCLDYCICVETDGLSVALDATVTVSVVPREM